MADLDITTDVADAIGPPPTTVQLLAIVAMAAATLIAAAMTPDGLVALALLLTGTTLALVAALIHLRDRWRRWRCRDRIAMMASVLSSDMIPGFIADSEGMILRCNGAAENRFRKIGGETLTALLSELFANPGAILFRLQGQADVSGSAQDMVATRRGHLRLTVTSIGDRSYVWRFEDLTDRPGTGRAADALGLPMLTAGPSGTILFMNEAFRSLTGGRARTLDAVFEELPLVSGRTQQVRGVKGNLATLVAEIPCAGGRREIYLLPPGAEATESRRADWDAIQDLPVPLLRIARSGEILAANRGARSLLPTPIGAASRLSELLEGLGRPIIDWLSEAAEGRAVPGPQFLRGTGDHKDRVFQVTLAPAGEGDDRQLIAVLNDATEHKSLEAQFVQAQKMQAIGQLAGGVAHDFNNLLTAISGHCDLLLLRHDKGDQNYGDLIQIHQNANRAASLVGQLLAFSRKQNLMPEQLDLRDTLSDLTHLLNRLVGEKVTLTLNHDPGLLQIRADKRQLEQVLMNLVVNARDAMADGGEIRVETDNHLLTEPLVRDRATVPAGPWVRIRVIDEGTGIAPEKLPKIFEPFYTTKRPGEGTGLGLSTVYGIVKQTGGFIFVDSEVGEGTVFTLLLPSHEKQTELAPNPPELEDEALPSWAEGVVLLVEDESPVRAFASRALRLRGFAVLEADSAEAALDLLADPDLVIDIFVTDVVMPGKDGPTWVREALTKRPDTRVVFVSGYAEDAFSEQKCGIPNSVFLPKPFSLTELTATVQRQLN